MEIVKILEDAFKAGWDASHECATKFDYESALNDFLVEAKWRIEELSSIKVAGETPKDTDSLRELYGKKVSFVCNGDDVFTDDYVLWLEKKILTPPTLQGDK